LRELLTVAFAGGIAVTAILGVTARVEKTFIIISLARQGVNPLRYQFK
jgi:hypothetical protein